MQSPQDTPGAQTGRFTGHSPLDGAPLEPVRVDSHASLAATLTQAREAQQAWAQRPPHERAKRIKRLRKRLLQRAPELAEVMRAELGKCATESYTSELIPSADLFTYWARRGPRLLEGTTNRLNPVNFPGKIGTTTLQPKGVIGLISPWNFPVAIPLRTLVPALIAGNAVVFKPSEYAPRTGRMVAELFAELDVPGLVGLVQGDGRMGAALLEAGVDHVVFTGSVEAGRQVSHACASKFLQPSLELGGKDAAIVLADADIERTVEGLVWGAFFNAGQNCASIERVYVVETLAPKLIEAVVRRTQQLVVGDGQRELFDVGPLVRAAGLETVTQQVHDAIAQGATLRTGGQPTGVGLHYAPTVLTDVTDDMAVMHAETFGPVLPIASVRDANEAVARVNANAFGLTTSIWSRDLDAARRLAAQIRTGVVTLNNHGFTAALPHAPWHGRGASGGGTTNSPYAFFDLVQPHYLLEDRARGPDLWWFPHNSALKRISESMARLLAGSGHRLAALGALLRAFPTRWRS